MSGRNRQPAIQIVAGRGRGVLQPLRWRMASVVDERFSLHRPPQVVATDRRDELQTNHDRHRSTTVRIANVQGGYRQTTSQQPDRRQLHTVLPLPIPYKSAERRRLPRVQSVSFDHRVTVYPADDYDRTATCLIDHMRFRRRIQQTELILAPILTEKHRAVVRMRTMTI